jgi:cytochrome c oxidase subunit 3
MNPATMTPQEERGRKERSRRMLTWLMVIAIVMFFAGLTSAYVVSASGTYWVYFRIPGSFLLSTVAIVLSSIPAQLALVAARQDRKGAVAPLLLLTLALGVVFTLYQFKGWGELVDRGNHLVGNLLHAKGTYGVDYTITKDGEELVLENGEFYRPSDGPTARPLNAEMAEVQNTSSSYFYVLTWAHLAHLAFGLIALVVMVVQALRGRYNSTEHAGLWSGTVYWHFLGGLWIYLYLFLAYFH